MSASPSQPASERVVDAAQNAAATAGTIASQTASTISAKVNEISHSQTGKGISEHGASISEGAQNLANQAANLAKGLFNTAQEKTGEATRSASATHVPGSQQTLGGLVDQSRTFIGKALDSAAHAVAVEKKPDATPITGEKDVVDKASDFVDQARNVIAAGLKKAEEVVAVHPAGQTLGAGAPPAAVGGVSATGTTAGPSTASTSSTLPGVAPGTGAQEPYTSNLMGGVKQA